MRLLPPPQLALWVQRLFMTTVVGFELTSAHLFRSAADEHE
jgi:hypothetical protein